MLTFASSPIMHITYMMQKSNPICLHEKIIFGNCSRSYEFASSQLINHDVDCKLLYEGLLQQSTTCSYVSQCPKAQKTRSCYKSGASHKNDPILTKLHELFFQYVWLYLHFFQGILINSGLTGLEHVRTMPKVENYVVRPHLYLVHLFQMTDLHLQYKAM